MRRRAALTWVLFIPVAILNGMIREALFKPVVGELPAHQISAVTGSAAFLAVTYVTLHRQVETETDGTLLRIGFAWVMATIVFEFGFGHYVMGNSWETLLHDYDLSAGRVWPLVLLTLLFSPLLVKWLGGHDRWRRVRLST